jgi:hypothetical protein
MEIKLKPESLPRSNIVSLNTSIEAIKYIKCTYKCLICKSGIDPELFTNSKTVSKNLHRVQQCSLKGWRKSLTSAQ